jgi:hypothetical protein
MTADAKAAFKNEMRAFWKIPEPAATTPAPTSEGEPQANDGGEQPAATAMEEPTVVAEAKAKATILLPVIRARESEGAAAASEVEVSLGSAVIARCMDFSDGWCEGFYIRNLLCLILNPFAC